MPVILGNGSKELRTWLDPQRSSWSKELQSLLKPFQGDLEIYPVSKEVGKVGNNSPNFIVPVASTENKSNIANFFVKGGKNDAKGASNLAETAGNTAHKIKNEDTHTTYIKQETTDDRKTIDNNSSEDNAPIPVPKSEDIKGIKRELDDSGVEKPPKKMPRGSASPRKDTPHATPARKTRSATSNKSGSPRKALAQEKGSQKITNFFTK
jgi:hypothetical protein